MAPFQDNASCILAYLELFQALSAGEADAGVRRWNTLLEREAETDILLAPPFLREQFSLSQRELLLVMAALALEMDGGLRGAFRRQYGLNLPTVEYGLQLIEPICPSGVETVFAECGLLYSLLLTTAEQTAYSLERPLILCRAAAAFLAGLSFTDISGIVPFVAKGKKEWFPLHEKALANIRNWYHSGTDAPLYLCAPAGSGRRTLLCQACGGAVCVDLEESSSMSILDRDHIRREAAITAVLMSAPVCAFHSTEQAHMAEWKRFCLRHRVPLAVLVEDERNLSQAREIIRLPRQLSAAERETAWRFFAPQAEPDACPDGAMTVGAVEETAVLAGRYAQNAGRKSICREDVRQAARHRGGALEFGIRYDLSVTLEDMVLPEKVREQILLICQAVQSSGALAAWGLPQQREGVTAVFHGPSGVGKTMAAAAIAGKLGLPLLRADLSQIMDKYVGETEKHLARLLQSARENRCVLLFDEADSLFGKRAEVSTGHDKYANLSTSYLLQEIERYEGVALLSTNLLSNFDEAFLRRLHYIVHFTLPDAVAREELWRRVLPPERLEGEIPFTLLAQAELSPARINSAARNAAVSALAQGRERVDAAGLVRALRLEMEKNNKALPRALAGQ